MTPGDAEELHSIVTQLKDEPEYYDGFSGEALEYVSARYSRGSLARDYSALMHSVASQKKTPLVSTDVVDV